MAYDPTPVKSRIIALAEAFQREVGYDPTLLAEFHRQIDQHKKAMDHWRGKAPEGSSLSRALGELSG